MCKTYSVVSILSSLLGFGRDSEDELLTISDTEQNYFGRCQVHLIADDTSRTVMLNI